MEGRIRLWDDGAMTRTNTNIPDTTLDLKSFEKGVQFFKLRRYQDSGKREEVIPKLIIIT